MADVSEYKLKYHLAGVLDALGLPSDTYLSVGVIPDEGQGWTDERFDALVELLGGSVRPHYPFDATKNELRYFRTQAVDYGDRDGLRTSVTIHSPTVRTGAEDVIKYAAGVK